MRKPQRPCNPSTRHNTIASRGVGAKRPGATQLLHVDVSVSVAVHYALDGADGAGADLVPLTAVHHAAGMGRLTQEGEHEQRLEGAQSGKGVKQRLTGASEAAGGA